MFPFLKTKLFLFALLLAVVATFYYFGDPQKVIGRILPKLEKTPIAPLAETVQTFDTQKITQQFQETIQTTETELSGLSEKTVSVGKHTGNILGSSIEPASDEQTTPLHEKALEYGKYLYCKQVVEEYETINPTLKEE